MADMRDRLIEVLLQKPTKCTFEQLADFLLANGVILPPCKVGDTVWYELFGEINCATVYFCRGDVYRHGFVLTDANARDVNGMEMCFDGKCIGKTVFLTRKEAEKALREKENVQSEG